MNVLENIKGYFVEKATDNSILSNPSGTCPTCWGRSEWDGKFYKVIKDEHAKPGSSIYHSFISEVVNDHVAKTHNLKSKYICTNCNIEIPV